MNHKMKSIFSLLNPLQWINAAFGLLAAIFGSLMRLFGLMPHPKTDGFQNVQMADVEREAEAAKNEQEAIDEIVMKLSPAEIVSAYARASADDRLTTDLTVLGVEGQDWLLSLSDDDLKVLAMSTVRGCERSLRARAVKPIYSSPPENDNEAPVDVEEIKKQRIASQFRQAHEELWLAPGLKNPKVEHLTVTLH